VIDHVALLPAYCAAGTAVLVFLLDLVVARRAAVLAGAALGALATAAAAWWVGAGPDRATFCVDGAGCSYRAGDIAALLAVLFALLTLGVVALSAGVLRTGTLPPGEYCFLLACSMTGGVVLGYAGDLITLIVALETLTLPLYILVGLRRRTLESAEGAVTFFVVSVVATAVTLLGAALLYAATGAVHFGRLAAALDSAPTTGSTGRLVAAAVVLVIAGLAFKVAAVPFHAWAPAAYDGAPVPVAAYLSTASKLGGIVAILYVTVDALRPRLEFAGPALAVLAVLTMTVGNLVALRQRRMVRLLAWSSVAQAGYILAPLGAFALAAGREDIGLAVTATVAYTVFYVLLELAAFASVVALRPADADGGPLVDYRGAARRSPWVAGAFVLALVGLAGLPPGLAGLFAKVAIVRSLLGGGAGWLAVVVALNAVIGLAYYVRVAATLYSTGPAASALSGGPATPDRPVRPHWAVVAALAVATASAIVVGFAPQLVLDVAGSALP
jgi:NADH-quinone oxidoreductase subunit N